MEMNRMFVQVVNLTEGKIFSLPTLYTDRTEACVCGQNYIRDRQAENMSETLFFRVLNVRPDGTIAPSYDLWDDEDEEDDDEECPHPEQECCMNCPHYSECWDDEDEEENDFNWDDPSCQSSRKPVCGNCDNDCQFCPTNYDVDEEPSQPVNKEIIISGKMVAELIDLLRSKAPEAPEEPNYLFEHWND